MGNVRHTQKHISLIMNKLQKKNAILNIAIFVVCAIGLSFIGYGEGHIAVRTNSAYLAQNTPTHTHLSIIYEREYRGKCDLLHLEIDTTYHARGKKGYCYEVVCNDNVSLRSFDGEYTTLNISNGACFIEGSERKWLKTNDKKSILDYHCDHALMADDSSSWEAWYCNALPHRPDIARLNSHHKGLILAVRNNDNSYFLKAKHIKHTTI